MIIIFPLIMFTDWFLTQKEIIESNNLIRAGTGFLCGQAYIIAVILGVQAFLF